MGFEDFYVRRSDELVELCWLLTFDRNEAADVAQESMLRAYQRWSVVAREGSDPWAWTRTVALNLCRSRWRT